MRQSKVTGIGRPQWVLVGRWRLRDLLRVRAGAQATTTVLKSVYQALPPAEEYITGARFPVHLPQRIAPGNAFPEEQLSSTAWQGHREARCPKWDVSTALGTAVSQVDPFSFQFLW
jgi:hypothetical protein